MVRASGGIGLPTQQVVVVVLVIMLELTVRRNAGVDVDNLLKDGEISVLLHCPLFI